MQDAKRLIDKINEDTQLKVNEIISDAEKKADEIISEARTTVDEIWDDMSKKAQRDSEEEHRRIISTATLDNKKKILRAKQEIIEKAFKLAAKHINEMDSRIYESFISKLIIDLISGKSAKIFVAYNDRSRLSSKFIDNINASIKAKGGDATVSFSDVDYDINEGFVISQGRYQMDVSLDNLIGMQRDELESDIVDILFR